MKRKEEDYNFLPNNDLTRRDFGIRASRFLLGLTLMSVGIIETDTAVARSRKPQKRVGYKEYIAQMPPFERRLKYGPWKEKWMKRAARKNPALTLGYLDKYIDKTWAKTIVKIVANHKKHHVVALWQFEKYKKQSWAAVIIRGIAKKYPESIFIYAKYYNSLDWSEGFLSKLFAKYPKFTLKHADKLGNFEWIRMEAKKAARRKPRYVLKHKKQLMRFELGEILIFVANEEMKIRRPKRRHNRTHRFSRFRVSNSDRFR